eukprot:4662545-Amphidinium_carterae.2
MHRANSNSVTYRLTPITMAISTAALQASYPILHCMTWDLNFAIKYILEQSIHFLLAVVVGLTRCSEHGYLST